MSTACTCRVKKKTKQLCMNATRGMHGRSSVAVKCSASVILISTSPSFHIRAEVLSQQGSGHGRCHVTPKPKHSVERHAVCTQSFTAAAFLSYLQKKKKKIVSLRFSRSNTSFITYFLDSTLTKYSQEVKNLTDEYKND